MEVYTSLTNALENATPFSERPFLLTFLLGKPFISRTADLSNMQNCTKKLYEYFQLVESTLLNLNKAEGGLELVLSSPRIGALFSLHSTTITNQVRSHRTSKLLLQYLHIIGDYPLFLIGSM